jgi:hypothetical protein
MKGENRPAVYVKFPLTGLGNMLLTWSRGFLFARLNGLEMVTSGWGAIRWGSWLRWERKKRMYGGYFKEDNFWKKRRMASRTKDARLVIEPTVEKCQVSAGDDTIFLFNEVSPGQDLFGPMRAYRDLIRQGILDMLSPRLARELEGYKDPAIALHIRRGDFKLGNPITPLAFFIDAIKTAREASGRCLPVMVFTDAAPSEIKEVMELPEVSMATEKADILDILLMGRSRMIVLSRSSTFSYWGAFLSDGIVVRPSEDWQGDIRPRDVNDRVFEGKVSFDDEHSVMQLKRALAAHSW